MLYLDIFSLLQVLLEEGFDLLGRPGATEAAGGFAVFHQDESGNRSDAVLYGGTGFLIDIDALHMQIAELANGGFENGNHRTARAAPRSPEAQENRIH
jgi:hypothetical protein